ncbi:MAG TPA: hypothetical protein VEC37_17695 [Bacillota bacterium]|nr:hypothetical protein [Bacillota bacterium]
MRQFFTGQKFILGFIWLSFLISGCGGGRGSSNTSAPINYTGSLIINEIGNSYNDEVPRWLEIYNNSNSTALLSQFQLRTSASVTRVSPIKVTYSLSTFNLPAIEIPAGSYVIIRSNIGPYCTDGKNIVHVSNNSNDSAPFWEAGGFIELIRNGKTIDFVRFGNNTATPETTGEWTGESAPSLPYSQADIGKSLSRNGLSADTNTASDWKVCQYATLGGPNDVTSDNDTDRDGIPDCSEQAGSTFAGLPLYDWGARVGQRDIFIHIDYMNSIDPGVTPRREALDKVKAAFQAKNIMVHFDVGNLYSNSVNPVNYNLDGRNHCVPFAQAVGMGTQTGKANIYQYKVNYMPLAKKQIFHYLLMAYSQNPDGSGGSSGVAEVNGNDFIVTLGNWGLNANNAANSNRLINYQAGTIMHEFGHNLGLYHGGDETNINFKPNYVSIMNYLYQLYGLPKIGNNEGDRYYYWRAYVLNQSQFERYVPLAYDSLINGPKSTGFVLDYSNGSGGAINESAVVESDGLRRTGSNGIDFNGNGVASDIVSMDLNSDGTVSSSVYGDYNDWQNINLFFIRDLSSDYRMGISKETQLKVWQDKVGNDRQKVLVETLQPPKSN